MQFKIIVKASQESEAGVLPNQEVLTKMGNFNEELANAGVLLAVEELQARSLGGQAVPVGRRPTSLRAPELDFAIRATHVSVVSQFEYGVWSADTNRPR